MNPDQGGIEPTEPSDRRNVLKVLYVHHAGPFGGASRSLFELIRSFPEGVVLPLVLTRHGQFSSILDAAGIETIACRGISQFDNTRYSHYRGARWLVLLRELAYLPMTLFGLVTARRRWGRVDLVHINDMTLIPAIWLAKKLFSCPVVVHVRSVQRPLMDKRGKMLRAILKRYADRLVAIDETVCRSVEDSFKPVVVHNGLTIAPPKSGATVRKDDVFTIGMVGGLSRAKGCLDFIDAAKICRDRGKRIRFVFVGHSMRPPSRLRDLVLRFLGLSQEIEEELRSKISNASLGADVEFWPFTLDLANVYGRFDAICFPSHFDAPGRPIFEAALYGVPSIAAITQPTPDTVVNLVTGLLVPPRHPDELAEAILFLVQNPQKCKEMGENARKLAAENFDIQKNALRVLGLYRDLVHGYGEAIVP